MNNLEIKVLCMAVAVSLIVFMLYGWVAIKTLDIMNDHVKRIAEASEAIAYQVNTSDTVYNGVMSRELA